MNKSTEWILLTRQVYTLADLIRQWLNADVPAAFDSWCLYVVNADAELTADTPVYLDDYPDEDAMGDDVFPPFIDAHGLELSVYGEQLVDVVDNLQAQGGTATPELVIAALNVYLETDNFMNLN